MSKKSTLVIELSAEEANLKVFEENLNRLQFLLGQPNKGDTISAAIQITRQIAEYMYEKGLPLGFDDEAGDEFIQISSPLLNNLITIARERSRFPEDTEPPPSP